MEGYRGREPRRKGAGSAWEAGKGSAGSGIPKVAGNGRRKKKIHTSSNILQSKKRKEAGSKKKSSGNRD